MNKKILFVSILFVIASCTNKTNQTVPLGDFNRIISLSPSITKQIISLGQEDRIIGVTSYHPKLKLKKEIIGTIVNPNIEVIFKLKPDLILYSDEDSATQKIEGLNISGVKLYKFKKNRDFQDLSENYLILAKILKKENFAKSNILKFEKKLKNNLVLNKTKRVAFFVSTDPLITVSNLSFIGSIIKSSGGINVYENLKISYPVVTLESLLKANPNIIIVMSSIKNDFFKNVKIKFPNLKSKIIFLKPDNVAYYTLENYLNSQEEISKLLYSQTNENF